MAYLGLDVGTSGCKAAIVSKDGEVIKLMHREYKLENPFPGYIELDPNKVWMQVVSVLREAAQSGETITKMAVSSIGESLVIVDKEDRVLMNGITYLDERGQETVEEIRSKITAEELYDITRVPISYMYSLNKLLWIRRNKKEVEEKADKYFMFGDFINYKMTGKRMIDPSSASRTLLLDADGRRWSEKIADLFGIPLEKFPQIRATGTNMGAIRKEIAEETGLPETLEVILGCHDQCSALLGTGCMEPGDITASEGSSESINLLVERAAYSDEFYKENLCFEPYIMEGTYMVPMGFLSHGTSIRWFLDKFGADFGDDEIKNRYERADAGCPAECGDLFCVPYLSSVKTRDTKDQTKGCFVGLDFTSGRAEMYRALLEGLCFESRAGLEVLQKMGLKMNMLIASGGCSKSELLMQMKADVCGLPVRILQSPESGIMGLAAICAVEDNVYPTYAQAVKKFVKLGKTYHPHREYEDRYKQYKNITENIRKLYNGG